MPNLIHRFRDLGISTAQYSVVSSVYSASQIVGGLIIGYLGDNVLGRKRVLLLSDCVPLLGSRRRSSGLLGSWRAMQRSWQQCWRWSWLMQG